MTALEPPDWVEPRAYQRTAIQRWVDADGQGILNMATGTGKTITALLSATQVVNSLDKGLFLVIAVPYQHLVDQWTEELEAFGVSPVLAYQSRADWQPRLERELLEFNHGSRSLCVVVTTHRTLSMDPAQRTLQRATGPMMIIGDEVHHLGAEQMRKGLSQAFNFRLGLSATPERWYDESGTLALRQYFGETVFEYGLSQAIDAAALCEYYYVPHIVELTAEEIEEYRRLTAKVGRLSASSSDDVALEDNPALQQTLFKRARLIGTARRKLDILVDLLEQESGVSHTLVYCSDGSTGVESGTGERHVDATTDRLRTMPGLTVERFTARESQPERERLLERFDAGEIDVLTSIRCLDEGVDVPATRSAYILASTSNPRQYVQRRGRILRTHPGKEFAVIHDFITVPSVNGRPAFLSGNEYEAERRLLESELERVSTFADAARNHPDADIDGVLTTDGSLQRLKRQYDLLGA
ncbi:DEAD/DEAH box helicase family protein [Natrinema sp. SYSU A 869]|uniref:DEAD/DEAH box helicase family protein n=1 Tax=Natrinema sp. SYSU A 869 TaxID=2871694 RepID=UPI001CA45FF4|nr:DEAD/DEAH box helicase family protein [Natrinema sp. SYSU A 869]